MTCKLTLKPFFKVGVSHAGAQRQPKESWSSQSPRQSLLVARVQVLIIWPLFFGPSRVVRLFRPCLAWTVITLSFCFRFFETKTSGPLPNRFSLPLPRRLKRWLKAKICRERERSRPALSSVSVQDLTKWSGDQVWLTLPSLPNLNTKLLAISKSPKCCRGCVYLQYPDSH